MNDLKRKLIKYPKYFFLGLYLSFKKDPGDVLVEMGLPGLLIGVPILSPIFYLTIDYGTPVISIGIILSMMLAMVTWWGLVLLLAIIFIILPSLYAGLKKYVELGEKEEGKVFEILRKCK